MRHAQTEDNLVKRFTGSNYRVGINKDGTKQIKTIIPLLRKRGIKSIYSSPYRRCFETASLIKKYLKVNLIVDTKLKEVNYGKWQGLTSSEAKEKYPKIYLHRGQNPASIPPPGGETLLEMQKRVTQKINGIMRSKNNSLIVTHGSCIHAALMFYQDIDLNKFWEFSQANKLQNCTLWEILITPNKTRIIKIDTNL